MSKITQPRRTPVDMQALRDRFRAGRINRPNEEHTFTTCISLESLPVQIDGVSFPSDDANWFACVADTGGVYMVDVDPQNKTTKFTQCHRDGEEAENYTSGAGMAHAWTEADGSRRIAFVANSETEGEHIVVTDGAGARATIGVGSGHVYTYLYYSKAASGLVAGTPEGHVVFYPTGETSPSALFPIDILPLDEQGVSASFVRCIAGSSDGSRVVVLTRGGGLFVFRWSAADEKFVHDTRVKRNAPEDFASQARMFLLSGDGSTIFYTDNARRLMTWNFDTGHTTMLSGQSSGVYLNESAISHDGGTVVVAFFTQLLAFAVGRIDEPEPRKVAVFDGSPIAVRTTNGATRVTCVTSTPEYLVASIADQGARALISSRLLDEVHGIPQDVLRNVLFDFISDNSDGKNGLFRRGTKRGRGGDEDGNESKRQRTGANADTDATINDIVDKLLQNADFVVAFMRMLELECGYTPAITHAGKAQTGAPAGDHGLKPSVVRDITMGGEAPSFVDVSPDGRMFTLVTHEVQGRSVFKTYAVSSGAVVATVELAGQYNTAAMKIMWPYVTRDTSQNEVFNVLTGEQVNTFNFRSIINGAASPLSTRVAYNLNSTPVVLDVETCVHYPFPDGASRPCAISPDGNYAAAHRASEMVIFEVATRRIVHSVSVPFYPAAVALAPGGNMLAAVDTGKSMLWSAEKGVEVAFPTTYQKPEMWFDASGQHFTWSKGDMVYGSYNCLQHEYEPDIACPPKRDANIQRRRGVQPRAHNSGYVMAYLLPDSPHTIRVEYYRYGLNPAQRKAVIEALRENDRVCRDTLNLVLEFAGAETVSQLILKRRRNHGLGDSPEPTAKRQRTGADADIDELIRSLNM